jgi:E3 ubiquitin-protein ligase HERC4
LHKYVFVIITEMTGWRCLPDDVLMLILDRLDAKSLACVAMVSIASERNLIVQTLLLRAYRVGECVIPCELNLPRRRGFNPPYKMSSWSFYLAWLKKRREDAWMPVAVGRQAGFFVADGGELKVNGVANRRYNECSLLGIDARSDIEIINPIAMSSVESIRFRNVSCGYDFCVAVSLSGLVYTWGAGAGSLLYPGRMTHGRVGLGHGDRYSKFVPTLVQGLVKHRVFSVSTGYSHCIAVAESGAVFSWGLDDFGQCGHGAISKHTHDNCQLTPARISVLVRDGARARNSSAGRHHSVVVTEKGSVYTFGRGTSGVLGHGDRLHQFTPKIVRKLSHVCIASTASGDNHTLALTVDGMVFSWGENVVGELGTGTRVSSDIPVPVHSADGASRLRNIRCVAATLYASCAVSALGELYTWGYGALLGHGADKISSWGTCSNFILLPRRVEELRSVIVRAISLRRWENEESQTTVVTDKGMVLGWGWGTARTGEINRPFPDSDPISTPCIYSNLTCSPPFGVGVAECDIGEMWSKISYHISTQF